MHWLIILAGQVIGEAAKQTDNIKIQKTGGSFDYRARSLADWP
jgi:hypothetical protein